MHPGLTASVRDLAFILFKRKWSVVTIFIVALLSTAIWLWLIRDDIYEVSASILVKLGHEQSLPPTMLGDRPMMVMQRYQDVNSEVNILQNTELIAQVVDALGLDKPAPPQPVPDKLIPRLRYYGKAAVRWVKESYEEVLISVGLRERLTPREKAVMKLKEGLHVIAEKDANVIIATLQFPIRQGSSVVLNTLLDAYQRFRPRMFYDVSAVDFFTGQVQTALADLHAAEQALDEFEASAGISLIAKQQEVLVQQIAEAQAAADAARVAAQEAASKLARFDQEMSRETPRLAAVGAFERGSFPDTLLLQMAELGRERERLRTMEFDDGVRIENNRSQFQVLANLLGTHLRSVLAERQALYDNRKHTLDDLQGQLNALHRNEMEWHARQRKVKVVEEQYVFYRKKLDEADARAALEREHVGNVVIIEHALDPLAPSGMRKTTLLLICLAVTAIAALAWVSIVEFFDHSFYTPEALTEYLGVPVIAVIPAE